MRAKLCKSFSSCNRGPWKHFLSLFIESEQMIQLMALGGAIEIDLRAVPGESTSAEWQQKYQREP